jgi:hypothetical protein
MVRPIVALIVASAVLGILHRDPTFASEASEPTDAVWTAIIPDTFPRNIYTWHLNADGSYFEDGRDAATGRPVQSTLHGHWSRDGAHMILRQDGLPYVFDGTVLGNLYAGMMTFHGRASSRFCAAKGEQPPARCSPPQGVATADR